MPKRSAILASLAILTFAAVGCSSDSQDSISSEAESVASDVSTAVEDAATDASAALDDAATEASGAIDDAVTDASGAVDDAVTAVSAAADDVSQEAAETVARNIAGQWGAEQFSDAGHPIDGELDCEATVTDSVEAVEIMCTGTTEEGGEAELTGTTDEVPGASVTELTGDFTGTVDGDEVFTTTSLGA